MFDVYLKLAALAHPVIRHYAADFYLHDARVLRSMKPGDVALWAARESGSCLVIVARNGIANERALESINCYVGTFAGLDWQLIDTDSAGDWTVEPEPNPVWLVRKYAEKTANENRNLISAGLEPNLVSELHM